MRNRTPKRTHNATQRPFFGYTWKPCLPGGPAESKPSGWGGGQGRVDRSPETTPTDVPFNGYCRIQKRTFPTSARPRSGRRLLFPVWQNNPSRIFALLPAATADRWRRGGEGSAFSPSPAVAHARKSLGTNGKFHVPGSEDASRKRVNAQEHRWDPKMVFLFVEFLRISAETSGK